MRYTLVLFVLLMGAVCPLTAQTTPDKPADRSKQDVVVELLMTRASFENDGTFSRHIEYRAQLLTEVAVKQATVVIFPYNNRLEAMHVDYVRVVKAGGKKVEASLSSIEEMPSQIQREAQTYGDFREKHVPVPALDPGDRLEYAYTTSSRRPLVPGQFAMEHQFVTAATVLGEELAIDVPAGRALKIKWAEGLKPEVRETNGRREYRVRHSQPIPQPEEIANQAPPAVRLSTFQSWQEVGRWFADAMKEAAVVTPEVKAKVAELAPATMTDRARAEAVYAFVSTRIRTVGLAFGARASEPAKAAEILNNGYGDIIDKCGLLSAMLAASGFPSSLELVRAGDHFDPDVPSPTQFNYLVAKVVIGGNPVWLDVVSEVAPFGHLAPELRGKNVLEASLVGDSHLFTTPAASMADAVTATQIRGSIDGLGALAVKVIRTFAGDAEMGARQIFRAAPARDWPALIQRIDGETGLVGEVSDLVISDPLNLQKPFRIEYSVSNPTYAMWAAPKLVPPSSRLAMIRAYSPEQRSTPIPLQASEESLDVELTIPAGISARPPLSIDLNRGFADYSSKYSVEGSTLKVHRTLKIVGQDLPRARYSVYNDFLDTMLKEQQQAFAISGTPVVTGASPTAKLPLMAPEPGLGKQSPLFQEALRAEQYGEVRKAEEGFKKVLAQEPRNAVAWYELGQVYSLMRQRESAIKAWKKAVEIDPFQQSALKQVAMTTWQLGRYDEAQAAVRKLLDITPLDPAFRMNLGELLVLRGKPKEGIPYLETAVSQDSKNTWARTELARAYLLAGDTQKGIAALQDLVHDFPGPGIFNSSARVLADAGVELDRAQQYANDGLSILYPLLQSDSGDQPEPLRIATRSLVGFLWDSLGWVYFKRGELTKASEYLKAAWVYTQNGDVGAHYAQLLLKQGDTAQATRVLAQALAASGDVVTPTSAQSRPLLEKLVGPARAKQLIFSGSTELQEMRTIRLGQQKKLSGSADWKVIFRSGQKPRLEFVGGYRDLEVLKPALENAKYSFELPADVRTPLSVKGILSCSLLSGCMMVLNTPAGLPPPGIFSQGLMIPR